MYFAWSEIQRLLGARVGRLPFVGGWLARLVANDDVLRRQQQQHIAIDAYCGLPDSSDA